MATTVTDDIEKIEYMNNMGSVFFRWFCLSFLDYCAMKASRRIAWRRLAISNKVNFNVSTRNV